MAQLKVGDVVQLKSGGPHMTVNGFVGSSGQMATCTWFEKNDHKQGNFAVDALKIVREEEESVNY